MGIPDAERPTCDGKPTGHRSGTFDGKENDHPQRAKFKDTLNIKVTKLCCSQVLLSS